MQTSLTLVPALNSQDGEQDLDHFYETEDEEPEQRTVVELVNVTLQTTTRYVG